MSTSKRIVFINVMSFLLIGCIIAFYIIYNMTIVRNFAEKSFISNEKFRNAVEVARNEIESEGLTSNNYDDFADQLLEQEYFMIVVKNNKEIYWNLDASMRTRPFYKAFKRSIDLTEDFVIINEKVMIYVLFDPDDDNLSYHIIDLNSNSYLEYQNTQRIFLIALICQILIVIVITTILQAIEAARPLRQLSIATHEIRTGNLEYEIKTKYIDEIGQIYIDFEALRIALKDAKSEREIMARDREEYIAGITHDLKTPLTSILGFSKGLLDGIANTEEKNEKYIKIIYDTAKHMNILIEKLKDFSKIDNDKLELNFERVNVIEFINDFVDSVAIAYHTSNVTVTSRLSVSLISQESTKNDYIAMIDKEEFRRVLVNILNNTVKYKHKGMGYSEILISRGYGQIIITIKDDGPGVKEQELESIFNCFYRGDSSRTRPTEGSGLGLYVAWKIILAHKGTVKAVNDKGLKIIITLKEAD